MNSNSSVSDFRNQSGYSTVVSITLVRNGQSIDVAQVGGERLYFEHPITLQPGEYSLVRTVDGNERSWNIEVAGDATASDSLPFRVL